MTVRVIRLPDDFDPVDHAARSIAAARLRSTAEPWEIARTWAAGTDTAAVDARLAELAEQMRPATLTATEEPR